jgi:hypothetical protein
MKKDFPELQRIIQYGGETNLFPPHIEFHKFFGWLRNFLAYRMENVTVTPMQTRMILTMLSELSEEDFERINSAAREFYKGNNIEGMNNLKILVMEGSNICMSESCKKDITDVEFQRQDDTVIMTFSVEIRI